MNHLTIIGNLTRDPVTRTTPSGATVCSFTVAVNRRQKDQNGQSIADYFAVSAWNKMAETCQKYLSKGRKVAVEGHVSVHTYNGQDGKTYAQLDVMATDVEFLSPKSESQPQEPVNRDPQSGYETVETDELPF